MVVREFLEKGRDLAERIPYSVIPLAARFAVADVFWRSGQQGWRAFPFAKRASTFFVEYKVPLLAPDLAAYLSTAGERVFPILLFLGLASRLSALGLFRDDYRHPLFVVPLCLDRCASRHRQSHGAIQDGVDGDRLHYVEREGLTLQKIKNGPTLARCHLFC
jgi:putative oxidoreductase